MAVFMGLLVLAGCDSGDSNGNKGKRPVPVEVAPIRQGHIELKRTFSGTLEAAAEFVVAPKVDGRVVRLEVDLGDTVTRGQIVAELDSREHSQAVLEAQAELAVAEATHFEAQSALEIASREFQRIEKLRKTGVVSASQHDSAQAEQLGKQAALKVAAARMSKAEASLASARIRLSYTKVSAEWNSGGEARVIAQRFVDEGETVSENTPLVSIVELDPITGVILVTEKEYAHMVIGQEVAIATDAYPGRIFTGAISRIAPVFSRSTRQARVEISTPNPDGQLKPGMFIRTTVIMQSLDQATLVPDQALTTRDNRIGVFLLDEGAGTVTWKEVTVGIREGNTAQVMGQDLVGRVVTLGQQFIQHGSAVKVSGEDSATRNQPEASGKDTVQ
ncbi:efflux transporter, RND family, MFP subunit [Desulfovibrio ferrophilus]|uniref:Efflux transporter, RND family, MFP subunit n=1 Tax=Desulfovibrio ferrophilus TaxID=241368 RepID=A0A2Z6B242_9BACT|nr:efflux transporter, RND family, MFP subunit [Desulfovibrio ferrophilus]